MKIRTKLIKDLMSVAEAYKEGETSAIGTMTDMGLLLDNFMKAESQKSNNGIEEVYIPANDDVEQLINIDYWFEVPQK